MTLRKYQKEIVGAVIECGGSPIVQLDTGAGKTPVIAALCAHYSHSIVLVHRNELAVQASEKLAAIGVAHTIITSKQTQQRAAIRHVRAGHGRGHAKTGQTTIVASVQSLLSMHDRAALDIDYTAPWHVMIDEAHHALADNMWGRALGLFANPRAIGFSGTPARLDGRSLHASDGGLFTDLIQSAELSIDSTKTLIGRGYLCDFRYFAPSSKHLSRSINETEVAGCAIERYRAIADGTQAICLCVSIAHAKVQSDKFRAAGIPSACISSDMGGAACNAVIDDFARKDIRVLCAVDMVSEGFDCPEAETLICMCYTASFVRYRQWVGRVLRPAQGKVAKIIDMVGLVFEHGMPDDSVAWSLTSPPKNANKLRSLPCPDCGVMYSIADASCPECGAQNPLLQRGNTHSLRRHVLERIDMGMVERERVARSAEDAAHRYKTELQLPQICIGGATGRVIEGLRTWVADAIVSGGVSISAANDFFGSSEARSKSFWIDNFSAADLAKKDQKTAMKGYKKWLKSR